MSIQFPTKIVKFVASVSRLRPQGWINTAIKKFMVMMYMKPSTKMVKFMAPGQGFRLHGGANCNNVALPPFFLMEGGGGRIQLRISVMVQVPEKLTPARV